MPETSEDLIGLKGDDAGKPNVFEDVASSVYAAGFKALLDKVESTAGSLPLLRITMDSEKGEQPVNGESADAKAQGNNWKTVNGDATGKGTVALKDGTFIENSELQKVTTLVDGTRVFEKTDGVKITETKEGTITEQPTKEGGKRVTAKDSQGKLSYMLEFDKKGQPCKSQYRDAAIWTSEDGKTWKTDNKPKPDTWIGKVEIKDGKYHETGIGSSWKMTMGVDGTKVRYKTDVSITEAPDKDGGKTVIARGLKKLDGGKTIEIPGTKGIERQTSFDKFGHITQLKCKNGTQFVYKWDGDKLKEISDNKGQKIVVDGDKISFRDDKGADKFSLKGKISPGKGDVALTVTTADQTLKIMVDGSTEIVRKEGGIIRLDNQGKPTFVQDATGNRYEFKDGKAQSYTNRTGKFERIGTDADGYDIYRSVGGSHGATKNARHLKITAQENGMVTVVAPGVVVHKHSEVKPESGLLSLLGGVKLNKDVEETTTTTKFAMTMNFGLNGKLMPVNQGFGNFLAAGWAEKICEAAEKHGFIARIEKPGDLLLLHAGNKANARAIIAAKLLTGQEIDKHDQLNFVLDLAGVNTLDTYSFVTVKDLKKYVRNFQIAKDGRELIEDIVVADLGGGMKMKR